MFLVTNQIDLHNQDFQWLQGDYTSPVIDGCMC